MTPDSLATRTASMSEYRRPWKMASLLAGIGLLVAGSFHYEAPDWDIPISLVMAALAYLTAPWSLRVIVERRWKLWPAMLFATWFTVDGCYAIYWHFRNPVALEMMRSANFLASLTLYGMCGLVWYYNGTLGEMRADASAAFRRMFRWADSLLGTSMPASVSSQPFQSLAASLRESGFVAHSERLDSVLNGTWTTSSELIAELGLAVIAAHKECRPQSSAQKALIRQCLREVHKAWPGFGLFSWLPFR